MDHVRWGRRPSLRNPVIIVAFEGWNDAGDSSTLAINYLRDCWRAEAFATIDPEEFFDFTSVRPQVSLEDGCQTGITWPSTSLYSAILPEQNFDLLLLVGVEPQLKWRTFARQITSLADTYQARLVITLGALLAEVPHSRPVSIIGSASAAEVVAAIDLTHSSYEGPSGIVAVVHDACMAAGFRAASLWAEVPTYVPAAPSPKAALALVRATAALLGLHVDTTSLEISAESYERQITELVAADDDTFRYVERLERDSDENLFDAKDTDGGELVEELERFLRDRHHD